MESIAQKASLCLLTQFVFCAGIILKKQKIPDECGKEVILKEEEFYLSLINIGLLQLHYKLRDYILKAPSSINFQNFWDLIQKSIKP